MFEMVKESDFIFLDEIFILLQIAWIVSFNIWLPRG